ncbi:hypothetical protein F3J23_20515 [Chryseobacterium sp. Tr-659]|uniref:hypothetical protein n=1 Tax=Chryseobacterium sp. Tr-659 TaxID=2608340 RepID=UPI0014243ACB|nr:hypothetical protein [Chryseobacterium sp. Tr-659]NIF07816.1 hypothetical protein [Chryseobacterium sp. Tr-659]
MKRTIIASLFMIIACKEEKKETKTTVEPLQSKEKIVLNTTSNTSEEAKKWLEKNIEKYFKDDLGSEGENMKKMTTKEYFDYKTDAMNVDLDVDGSLTEQEFRDKWKGKFDTNKAGIGVGFLITGQDWYEVKVTKCQLISEEGNNLLFNVILTDQKVKAEYPVKIKVIKENGSFLIADVLQEEPKLN